MLDWESLTWDEFVAGLRGYRERFYAPRHQGGEHAYLRARKVLGDRRPSQKARHARELVLFLNRWECHFDSNSSPPALADWMRDSEDELLALDRLTIRSADLGQRIDEVTALFDSLLVLKHGAIPTMGVACASKTLHQMIPPLFVMWDRYIQRYERDYGRFMLRMHELAQRLTAEAPTEAQNDAEGYLQRVLDYRVPKTLAKYLDEYNWYIEVGSTWNR